MKKLYSIIILGIIAIAVNSCVGDDDFATPNLEENQIEIDGQINTIQDILSELAQNGGAVEFGQGIDANNNAVDRYISGYVISNDAGGNVFKELIIQDAAENPTAGITIAIDVNPLFTRYEFGRKVFVKITGLTLAISNGVNVMGILGGGNTINRIAEQQELEFIQRDNVIENIIPTEVTFADFNSQPKLTWVRVSDVQFVVDDINRCFSCEPTDTFDGERTITSCVENTNVTIETSTFSDYKSVNIPDGVGSIDGILTRNFENNNNVLIPNTLGDYNLTDSNRCDPVTISCGTVNAAGPNVLLSEDFEAQSTGAAAMPAGWTNFQQDGSETWEVFTSGGTNASLGKSVRVGSFNSNDASTVAWLITPSFDFDATTGEVLSFETSNSFADGSTMEVLYSNDWDGSLATINSATWAIISDAVIVNDGDFFGDWIFSENVSLDCVTGNGNIAFRYNGSGNAGNDGTYELDNISITSN